MTDKEKRERGKRRLDELRATHSEAVMLQMVMGLTAGMLNLIDAYHLSAFKLWQLIGAMGDDDWAHGVKVTAEQVATLEGS